MRKATRRRSRLVLVWTTLFCMQTGAADSLETTPGDAQSGNLLLRMATGYRSAFLLNTDVNVQVSGLIARVSVMQEFVNDGSDWAEGVYVFPLPETAAVDHMRLYIGKRFIEGEIRKRRTARRDYDEAKRTGKKAGLVEQHRSNLFTTSIANVAPGETIIVEIEYLEDLRYDNEAFSLRFPMTLTPRYISGTPLPDRKGNGWAPDTVEVIDASLITPPMVTTSRGHRVSLTAIIDAGMPLAVIESKYHPIDVGEQDGRYTVTFADGAVSMDHDFELVWQPVPSSMPRAMVFAETIAGQSHFLLMVVPPNAGDAPKQNMPRDMVFIIDTSGSMHGVSIAQAKQALQRALARLQPMDRFNVVEFNSTTRTLFRRSVTASASNLHAADIYVRGLNANGGTEMRPALEYALRASASETHLRQIVFITDGSVGNEEALFRLIEEHLDDARLFTVGIGSAPNSWFMRGAAEAGRGSFTIISALHEVGEKMDLLFEKLERPQVTNIEVQWPGAVVIDGYPSVVPDLYSGEPVTVKARASGALLPGATVRIVGDSLAGMWSRELTLPRDVQNSGVAALWARSRIAALLDDERRGADAEETRQKIVETALTHHLVSKHTSLVAIDKTPSRPAGNALAREQIPNLMPYGQSTSAIFGFPSTATNAALLRLTGLIALLAAILIAALPLPGRRSADALAR